MAVQMTVLLARYKLLNFIGTVTFELDLCVEGDQVKER